MRILLALLLSVATPVCFAQDVDPWNRECDEGGCNLTLIKNVRQSKGDNDWFALGLSLSRAGSPNYFVFSYPPTPTPSQVVLSFVTLEKQAGTVNPVVREVASFLTQPCELRRDCKVRFEAAIVPASKTGSFREVNVWRALQERSLLDVQQVFEFNGTRVERGMLVALPALQRILGEPPAK